MHFALTPEQELARSALRELLNEHCTASHVRAVFETEPATRVPGLWAKLHELGVIGALASEAQGGVGLNAIDLTVLLEETGRAAVPEPVVETAFVALPLLAALPSDPRAAAALQGILSGQATASVALGGSLVPHAEHAELIICERTGELHLLSPVDSAAAGSPPRASSEPGGGINTYAGTSANTRGGKGAGGDSFAGATTSLTAAEAVDRARRLHRLAFEPSDETLLASGYTARPLLAAARDHAALGTAAQLIGLGARMLELTIAHVKTRKQFGQAVGAFQAVKHQLVDARLALEFAAPLVYRAAHSLAHNDQGRSLHVSMAKAFASEAALLAARKALQLHGAIGYSYEYELHLYMKRAWALAAAYGDAREHRQRIADQMLTTQGESHA